MGREKTDEFDVAKANPEPAGPMFRVAQVLFLAVAVFGSFWHVMDRHEAEVPSYLLLAVAAFAALTAFELWTRRRYR